MRATERALRAELKALGVSVTASAMARVAVDLAQRLDAGPTDRDAATLSRELRMVVEALYRRYAHPGGGELDAFLAGVTTTAFRGPGD